MISTLSPPLIKWIAIKTQLLLKSNGTTRIRFFDRDLNNFRLQFDLRAISVGVIITRCDALQEVFDGLGRGASYGASTTHMSKLLPRIEGGGGAGCPIIVFGISKRLSGNISRCFRVMRRCDS
ncbi:MAG: BglII/BstYI family type II restriction endonuclease [Planctomycetaceae bacterium]